MRNLLCVIVFFLVPIEAKGQSFQERINDHQFDLSIIACHTVETSEVTRLLNIELDEVRGLWTINVVCDSTHILITISPPNGDSITRIVPHPELDGSDDMMLDRVIALITSQIIDSYLNPPPPPEPVSPQPTQLQVAPTVESQVEPRPVLISPHVQGSQIWPNRPPRRQGRIGARFDYRFHFPDSGISVFGGHLQGGVAIAGALWITVEVGFGLRNLDSALAHVSSRSITASGVLSWIPRIRGPLFGSLALHLGFGHQKLAADPENEDIWDGEVLDTWSFKTKISGGLELRFRAFFLNLLCSLGLWSNYVTGEMPEDGDAYSMGPATLDVSIGMGGIF